VAATADLLGRRVSLLKGDDQMNVCESQDQRRSVTNGFGGSSDVVAAPGDIRSLRLYVAGQSPKSLRACADLMTLREQHLADQFEIEIIDLTQHPSLAQRDNIVAVPTLVVDVRAGDAAVLSGSVAVSPRLVNSRQLPTRRVVGELSQTDDVLAALGLPVRNERARMSGSAL
jgi:hypothetical protein